MKDNNMNSEMKRLSVDNKIPRPLIWVDLFLILTLVLSSSFYYIIMEYQILYRLTEFVPELNVIQLSLTIALPIGIGITVMIYRIVNRIKTLRKKKNIDISKTNFIGLALIVVISTGSAVVSYLPEMIDLACGNVC